MDDDGSKSLNKEEFSKGIRETGLSLSDEETDKLFNAFDKDGGGSINYDEFLVAIRVSCSKLAPMAIRTSHYNGSGGHKNKLTKNRYKCLCPIYQIKAISC